MYIQHLFTSNPTGPLLNPLCNSRPHTIFHSFLLNGPACGCRVPNGSLISVVAQGCLHTACGTSHHQPQHQQQHHHERVCWRWWWWRWWWRRWWWWRAVQCRGPGVSHLCGDDRGCVCNAVWPHLLLQVHQHAPQEQVHLPILRSTPGAGPDSPQFPPQQGRWGTGGGHTLLSHPCVILVQLCTVVRPMSSFTITCPTLWSALSRQTAQQQEPEGA